MTPPKGKLSFRKNTQSPSSSRRALMRRHKRLSTFYSKCSEEEPGTTEGDNNLAKFEGFGVSPLKPKIRVLSLFDGISTTLHALNEMGVVVDKYFSAEIDPKALSLQRFRFGDSVSRVGSVTDLTCESMRALGEIHLVIGGSPCNDLSKVNPRRRGLHDPSSTGNLFFEYVRIRDFFLDSAAASGIICHWVYENTFNMEVSTRQEMSRYLGCEPAVRDASVYLPVKRKRLFWSNVPSFAADVNPDVICLEDILPLTRMPVVSIIPTLTTTSHSQKSGQEKILPVIEDGMPSHLYITEIEALFGLPASYTDGPNLSLTDRRKLLGKAFCVPVLKDILTPLKDLFWVRQ